MNASKFDNSEPTVGFKLSTSKLILDPGHYAKHGSYLSAQQLANMIMPSS